MARHKAARDLHGSQTPLKDPGASGSITVDRNLCYVGLVSATAETRTLRRPTKTGDFVTIQMKTDGGDITLTVTGGFNEDGDTTFTFSDAGQFATFVSCYDGTNFFWRLVSHYGIGNITPTESGALDGLLATVTELNRAADVSTRVIAVPAATTTLTLTEDTHEGKMIVLASTGGLAITPIPATGSGGVYRFYFSATISGGNVTIDAKAGNASDVFYGWLETYKATTFTPYITASNSNLLTFDGSTRGGIKGDVIELWDVATNQWMIRGFTNQTGTIATPFSNH